MIIVDLNKAKEIVHEKRRIARTKEFTPLDAQVTIPDLAVEAENKRIEIRERYKKLQTQIDSVTNTERLKTILNKIGV